MHIRVVIVFSVFGIIEGKRRDRGAQHIHGQRCFGCLSEEFDDGRVEPPLLC